MATVEAHPQTAASSGVDGAGHSVILERTEEVARMLSGAKVTESSLKHAEQMIKANA